MHIERRHLPCDAYPVKVETRDGGGDTVSGYAAVFYRDGERGTEFQLMDGVVERIAPQAFDKVIGDNFDTRGMFNHSPHFILGRRSAGTLRVNVDNIGLRYEIDMPDTQVARDVLTSIRRGDITGSSFSFKIDRVTWIEDRERSIDIRQVDSVSILPDVGPVTFPAYEATTAGLRSAEFEELKQELEGWKEHKREMALETLKFWEYRARAAAI